VAYQSAVLEPVITEIIDGDFPIEFPRLVKVVNAMMTDAEGSP
jgi:hypothetical protein